MDYFVIAVIILFFVIIFQIAKASEYVSVLKGEEKANEEANKINGFLMLAFIIFGFIGIYWCQVKLGPKILAISASTEGEAVDSMMWWTLGVTGSVLVVTQFLLFYYAFKYQYKKGRKSYYYPHNNKLEAIWTAIPAIVMAGLVVVGLVNWVKMTKEAPANAYKIGIVGKQFGWFYHYPGKDGVLGKRSTKLTIDGVNDIGLDLNDKFAIDDIVTTDTMRLIKDSIVDMTIQSRDVIHDVGLTHFRMKMDAVPDMPTRLKFTPSKTTDEMKKITNDADFVYEISCDQICGSGHTKMRGVIVVYPKGYNLQNWNDQMVKDGKTVYNTYQEYLKKQKNTSAVNKVEQTNKNGVTTLNNPL